MAKKSSGPPFPSPSSVSEDETALGLLPEGPAGDAVGEVVLNDVDTGGAQLLSTAFPNGFPDGSAQFGWASGSQEVDASSGGPVGSGADADPSFGPYAGDATGWKSDSWIDPAFKSIWTDGGQPPQLLADAEPINVSDLADQVANPAPTQSLSAEPERAEHDLTQAQIEALGRVLEANSSSYSEELIDSGTNRVPPAACCSLAPPASRGSRARSHANSTFESGRPAAAND